MPDTLLSIVATVAFGGIGSLLITWATDGLDAARRSRRLDQMKAALDAKRLLAVEHVGHAILDLEVDGLLADIHRASEARPYWRSFVHYLIGVLILAGVMTPLSVWLFPGTLSQPWTLLIMVGLLCVIFAIESRPAFFTLLNRPVKRDSL